MYKFGKAMLFGLLALLFSIAAAHPIAAQGSEEGHTSNPIANGDRVYYAGFVSESPIPTDVRIVGSLNEALRQFMFRGERAYINKGRSQGVQTGQVYQIVRPLGAFYHPFKTHLRFLLKPRGDQLGYFNDEVGFARVVGVEENTSTVEITESYNDIRFGDVLIPFQKRDLPEQRAYTPIDPLAPPTGKTTGQIVFARSNREMLSKSDVVILDIGQKAGVKVGDYFTIFRQQGSESVLHFRDDEVAFKRNEAGSDRYRGSDFSLVHPSIQKEKIDKQYPGRVLPRTIAGELVITRVEGNTATGIITRTQNGEVLLGDRVELQ